MKKILSIFLFFILSTSVVCAAKIDEIKKINEMYINGYITKSECVELKSEVWNEKFPDSICENLTQKKGTYWSNKKDGPTSIEEAKSKFGKRKLDIVEGIWFEDGLGTVAIFKEKNIFKMYIVEGDTAFNGTWEATIYKRENLKYDYIGRVWYTRTDGYDFDTQKANIEVDRSNNSFFIRYERLSNEGVNMNGKFTRVWPKDLYAYNKKIDDVNTNKQQGDSLKDILNYDTEYNEVGEILFENKKYSVFTKKDFKAKNNKERKYISFINYDSSDNISEQYFIIYYDTRVTYQKLVDPNSAFDNRWTTADKVQNAWYERRTYYLAKNEFNGQDAMYGKWFDKEDQKWDWGVFITKKDQKEDCWMVFGYNSNEIGSEDCFGVKLNDKSKKELYAKAKKYSSEAENYFYFLKDLENNYFAKVTGQNVDEKIYAFNYSWNGKKVSKKYYCKKALENKLNVFEPEKYTSRCGGNANIIVEKTGPSELENEKKLLAEERKKLEKEKEKIAEEKRKLEKEKEKLAKERKKREENKKLYAFSSGSGFITSSGNDSNIITNFHVVEGCDNVIIAHKGGRINSKIFAVDQINDLAILKANINSSKVYPVSLQDAQLLEDVIIAGYPLGKEVSAAIKISKGSVSSLAGWGDNYSNFQTDAALNQGNSGGPIINKRGNVIGVAVANYGKKEGIESFNFGIKSSTLRAFANSNNINFATPNQRILDNVELGQLITEATVFLECQMTLAKIKIIIKEEEKNKKAVYKDFQD